MNLRRTHALLGALIIQAVISGTVFAGPYYFMGLGDLPGGLFDSRAYGISADGAVVVGSGRTTVGDQAFRWSLGSGMTGLGTLTGGAVSRAFGISDDGSVIVGDSGSVQGMQAFRWTIGAGMFGLGDLAGGPFESIATGVSGDGQVVVGSSRNATSFRAYRWRSSGGMEALPMPVQGQTLLPTSFAYATNSDGTYTVGSTSQLDNHFAARWTTQGASTSVQVIANQSFSEAFDVSSDGSVVAGYRPLAGGRRATRWTAQTGTVEIGLQTGFPQFNYALGVSADGSTIVGGIENQVAAAGAFIWKSSHGMRMLSDVLVNDYGIDLTGWTLSEARAVSADGSTLVGYGVNPSGNTEAWIAHIPEPTTSSLLMFGGALVLARRRSGR